MSSQTAFPPASPQVPAEAPSDRAGATRFRLGVRPLPPLRAAIAARHRCEEAAWTLTLADEAELSAAQLAIAQGTARALAVTVRAERAKSGGVDALMQEFSLSSHEGIALMCLAEALLRIPDAATRDRLIRDKISQGDWRSHVGTSSHVFVNAAAWGLLITGKLVATHSDRSLASGLTAVVRRGGEPLIRKGVDLAMRLLGKQFVTAETIEEALESGRAREARGYRFSYDMLGEAAATAADAERYFQAYAKAIHAIGRASGRRGIYAGPGISVKLSALHPRYARSQRVRVFAELLPRVKSLLLLAKSYDIGFNIDAEEADRLDLSLDILETLASDSEFASWDGIGFVVQAYQKRARPVLDWIVDLGERTGHRLMVRLVKGAYWDTEIKRAQIDGLADYSVFTRKEHTDVSYLACARRLLAAPRAVYPQFATHNAFTIGAICTLAGGADFEFQCLHGMGETLYDQVVGKDKLGVPCRIYAPVGSYETLLPYLVRRLLENGANTSFVHRLVDPEVSIEELIEDPVAATRAHGGAPHPRIPRPPMLFPDRRNSLGFDFSDEAELESLAQTLERAPRRFMARPLIASHSNFDDRQTIPLRNPADRSDLVGEVIEASPEDIDDAIANAVAVRWAEAAVETRALCLERWAELIETERATLFSLAVREAGKTLPNALGEVREAVDFCRYYARQARAELNGAKPTALGLVVCISPWNFPLSIFVGQVAAALAAGNPVLAKPAEQTPLMAAYAVTLAHRAGIPPGALQLLPGPGDVIGARLVADPRIQGVVFTGSTEVARSIHASMAHRNDDPVFIAETGGLNAMIVDSSALPEQVVADILASAFDSAGQRCSALRIVCLQEEIAERVLDMLRGAMQELRLGDPAALDTDVGPVIDDEARSALERHVHGLAASGVASFRLTVPRSCNAGSFVAPTLIELASADRLQREVFGPILHVVRYESDALPQLIETLNRSGYGLTHGIHTRIDETVEAIVLRIRAGNIYVNRNIIGAVVGVQPFGGEGLSGTGPKAGGPFYLHRLSRGTTPSVMRDFFAPVDFRNPSAARLRSLIDALPELNADESDELAKIVDEVSVFSGRPQPIILPGPTGEADRIELRPRGRIACIAASSAGLLAQALVTAATGNALVLPDHPSARRMRDALGAHACSIAADPLAEDIELVLADLAPRDLITLRQRAAARPGAIVPVVVPVSPLRYPAWRMFVERAISVNTAAAGGNAALMTLDDRG